MLETATTIANEASGDGDDKEAVSSTTSNIKAVTIPAAQRALLVELYHTAGGNNWTRRTNWLREGGYPCDPTAPW
jgi:hypothetical protein